MRRMPVGHVVRAKATHGEGYTVRIIRETDVRSRCGQHQKTQKDMLGHLSGLLTGAHTMASSATTVERAGERR